VKEEDLIGIQEEDKERWQKPWVEEVDLDRTFVVVAVVVVVVVVAFGWIVIVLHC